MPAIEQTRAAAALVPRRRRRLDGERLVAAVWDHPGRWLAVCVLITLAAAWQARSVSLDNSLAIWFAEDDPALASYREFQSLFGNDEAIVVAFHDADGILTAEGLALLNRAGEAVAAVDGIAGVESLATLLSRASGGLAPGPPNDGQGLPAHLVSADRTAAVLIARLQADPGVEQRRDAIIGEVRKALDGVGADGRMIGTGVIYEALNRLSQRDTATLFAAASLVMALLLWRALRRLAAVALCLVIVGVATIWVMGALGALGRGLNMVTMVLPTLVTVIGVANCVHVLRHVAHAKAVADRRERVVRALAAMMPPCFFVAMTTAAAFAALAVSPLPVLRDLGLFGAFGMVAVFALTFVLATVALRWPGVAPRPEAGRAIGGLAARASGLAARRHRLVLAATAGGLLAAPAAMSQLTVDTYSVGFLPADHPVRAAYRFVEEKFTAYTPLEFVVRAEPGVPDDRVLGAVRDWQRRGRQLSGVGWSKSPADPMPPTGPSDAGAERRLRADNAWRVSFAIPMRSARSIARDIDRLLAQANMPEGIGVAASGYLPLYVRTMERIVFSQVWGFAVAFAVVMAMMALLFRSARLAAVAVPVNLLPVAVVLGSMGLAGIPLDVATVTIAAIVLGMAVDDSIFMLDGFRRARARGLGEQAAIRAAAREAGASMVLSTLVLALGFLACAFADIKSVVWFGVLLSLAMTSALLADLVVLPALLAATGRRRDA